MLNLIEPDSVLHRMSHKDRRTVKYKSEFKVALPPTQDSKTVTVGKTVITDLTIHFHISSAKSKFNSNFILYPNNPGLHPQS